MHSIPKPCKNPAHSRATYEAPTIKHLPGWYGKLNKSSEVIQYSRAPGVAGYVGLHPVAIIKCLADRICDFESLSVTWKIIAQQLHKTTEEWKTYLY